MRASIGTVHVFAVGSIAIRCFVLMNDWCWIQGDLKSFLSGSKTKYSMINPRTGDARNSKTL